MIYYAIVELQNGLFNSVQAPYNSQLEAMEHRDKLLEYRKQNPNPLTYEYRIVKVNHPSLVA